MWWRRRPRRSEGRSNLSPSSRPSEARAGTPSHSRLLLGNAGATALSHNKYSWLWVPAFAGTTACVLHDFGSVRGRIAAPFLRALPRQNPFRDRCDQGWTARGDAGSTNTVPRSFPYVLENRIIRARYCTCGRRIHFRRPGWKRQHQPRRDEQYSRHPVAAGRQGEAADDRRQDQAELLSLARAQRTRRVCTPHALRLTSSRRARPCGSDLIVKQPILVIASEAKQ